jgi:hypothetical protein
MQHFDHRLLIQDIDILPLLKLDVWPLNVVKEPPRGAIETPTEILFMLMPGGPESLGNVALLPGLRNGSIVEASLERKQIVGGFSGGSPYLLKITSVGKGTDVIRHGFAQHGIFVRNM